MTRRLELLMFSHLIDKLGISDGLKDEIMAKEIKRVSGLGLDGDC